MKEIALSCREWNDIVEFFRAEEKVCRDSYGIPGQEDTWRKEFKRMEPESFKLYERAQKAILAARLISKR